MADVVNSPTQSAEEAPPKPTFLQATVEVARALVQETTLQYQLLQLAITTRAKERYDAGSARVHALVDLSRFYILRSILVLCVLLAICVLLVADLSGCFVTSVAAAAGVRRFVLANVPGTTVVPLHFNALPFHNDDWQRHMPEDAALKQFFLPDRETRAAIAAMPRSSDATHVLDQRVSQYVDMKFSLLNHFVNSHLASTSMHIPRASTASDLFSPKGGVNLERLFQLGPAMFNAKGEYTAHVQVVVAKEEVGRDVPLVLESAMLFSEDAMSVNSLHQLDVLFKKSTTMTVRTGPPYRAFWVVLVKKLVRLCFYPPLRASEYLVSTLQQRDNAPFPPIDPTREVAVVLEVYRRFTPPQSLQPRLRAMNFSLYQLPDPGTPSRVKLTRMVFLSTVQLTGVARWLTDYPILTFLCMVAVVFGATACVSVGTVFAIAGYVYWTWLREAPSPPYGEDDSDREFLSPMSDQPPTTAKNVSFAAPRRRRSSDDLFDVLDTSQLRRSNSFSTSPAKKKA